MRVWVLLFLHRARALEPRQDMSKSRFQLNLEAVVTLSHQHRGCALSACPINAIAISAFWR